MELKKTTTAASGLHTSMVGQALVPAGSVEYCDLPPLILGRNVTLTIIPLTKIEHGAVTGGPFVPGEIISDGTSTGKVLKVESGYVLVATPSGEFSTGTITGGTSGASATITTVTQGSGKNYHCTSPKNAGFGAFNIEDGLEVYGESDDGEVSEYTTSTLTAGVSRLALHAIDVDCLFEVMV